MERFLLDFKKDGLLCLRLLTASHIDMRVDAHFDDCIPCFSCNVFLIPQLFQLLLEQVSSYEMCMPCIN
jgi:hypothetical protein